MADLRELLAVLDRISAELDGLWADVGRTRSTAHEVASLLESAGAHGSAERGRYAEQCTAEAQAGVAALSPLIDEMRAQVVGMIHYGGGHGRVTARVPTTEGRPVPTHTRPVRRPDPANRPSGEPAGEITSGHRRETRRLSCWLRPGMTSIGIRPNVGTGRIPTT